MRTLLLTRIGTLTLLMGGCAGVAPSATVTPTGAAGSRRRAAGAGRLAKAARVAPRRSRTLACPAATGGPCAPRCGDGKTRHRARRGLRRRQHAVGRRLCRRLPASRRTSTARSPASPASTWSSAATACSAASSSAIRRRSAHGCSATCKLEPGYVCDAPPAVPDPPKPATCHRTVCGDGKKEGTEACDDGNTVDGDGCSAAARSSRTAARAPAPRRAATRVKLAPEACDDGNTKDGDGCSHDCSWRRASPAPTRPPARRPS